MTATVSAAQPDRLENETRHYCEAEKWLTLAEQAWRGNDDQIQVDTMLRFAAVHAHLSVAADHDRIASCVPDGSSRLQVATQR